MTDKHTSARIAGLYLYGSDPDIRAMLEAVAKDNGLHIARTYRDTAAARPQLQHLQADVRAGELRAVMVWDIAELGRTVPDVIETVVWLDTQGVHLVALNPPLDTGTIDGRKELRLIRHLADYSASQRVRSGKRPR